MFRTKLLGLKNWTCKRKRGRRWGRYPTYGELVTKKSQQVSYGDLATKSSHQIFQGNIATKPNHRTKTKWLPVGLIKPWRTKRKKWPFGIHPTLYASDHSFHHRVIKKAGILKLWSCFLWRNIYSVYSSWRKWKVWILGCVIGAMYVWQSGKTP